MKRGLYLIPLLVVVVLGVFSVLQLVRIKAGYNVRDLPSVLINREVAAVDLGILNGRTQAWGSKDLLGQVTLVNIFGSWCISCLSEHPFLMHIKEQGLVPIFGIDWQEKAPQDGPRWLAKYGDPYTRIGGDPKSKAAIAFGVTGAPESFLIDQKGVIRYKQIGVIDAKVWKDTLWPLILELRKQ